MLIYYGTTEIKSLQYERNLERFDTAQKEEEDNGGKIRGRHTDANCNYLNKSSIEGKWYLH